MKLNERILVVGVGGIGCELLKNLVITGFKNLTFVDMDVVQLSNLNRQFLYREHHHNKPKVQACKESLEKWDSSLNIVAIHDDITKKEYSIDWFAQFNIVIMALDNAYARTCVNERCMIAQTSVIECGTETTYGYCYAVIQGHSQCYSCISRPPQINARESCTGKGIPHSILDCVVWAQNRVQDLIHDNNHLMAMDSVCACRQLFEQLFVTEITQLRELNSTLQISEIDFEGIDFVKTIEQPLTDRTFEVGITLSLEEHIQMFIHSLLWLLNEKKAGLLKPFKEDDEQMDKAFLRLITSAANIRAHLFEISSCTQVEALALLNNTNASLSTTNAVTAGNIVKLVLHLLNNEPISFTIWNYPSSLSVISGNHPNSNCFSCAFHLIKWTYQDLSNITLEQFITRIRDTYPSLEQLWFVEQDQEIWSVNKDGVAGFTKYGQKIQHFRLEDIPENKFHLTMKHTTDLKLQICNELTFGNNDQSPKSYQYFSEPMYDLFEGCSERSTKTKTVLDFKVL